MHELEGMHQPDACHEAREQMNTDSILVCEEWIMASGEWILVSGDSILEFGEWILASGDSILASAEWIPESGDRFRCVESGL